ncbi:LytTR family DNA-binding domain-containing protein [Alicyclobacillus sp.]|uniref:LytR/AlgR family response regulator transcription factor n=1 Tax=Alicyclobacillus sp. TaxID=61169 RepID=UPI0025BA0D80|nr:LytTR family DNA-binding domain-containing protein [Alicyclobacillus sp.]MCL6516468.1 LytTR family DNA-binding domain-containing protein [Alicyclobacillus sp.]
MIALIVEDEWAARDELTALLSTYEDVTLCPPASTAREALERMAAHHPDVIFLDIHLPGGSGVQVARHAAMTREVDGVPFVVFTTAYDRYAVEAFNVEAVDYLLKPYDPQRVFATVSRIRQRIANRLTSMANRDSSSANLLDAAMAVRPTPGSAGHDAGPPTGRTHLQTTGIRLLLARRDGFVVVLPDQIRFALRADRVVEVHTLNSVITVRTTLQDLEDRLHGLPFFRCHKSCLIHLHHIASIRPWVNGAYTVVMDDPAHTELPVSRHAARALFERMRQFTR